LISKLAATTPGGHIDKDSCHTTVKINVLKDDYYVEHVNLAKIQFVGANTEKYIDCTIIGMIPREKDGTSVNKNLKSRK